MAVLLSHKNILSLAVLLALTPLWMLGTVRGVALVPTTAADSPPAQAPAAHPEIRAAFGQLPLSFEANEGQFDPAVQFAARGPGYMLFLTPGEAVLTLRGPSPLPLEEGEAEGNITPPAARSALRMQLVGANPDALVAGQDALPGKVNYFRGNDPAQWRSDIPTYARIQYQDVYPGIDLVYYGSQGQLEYDFVVAPGADPSAIAVAWDGADELALDAAGELVLSLPSGEVRLRPPEIYQVTGLTRSSYGETRAGRRAAAGVGSDHRAGPRPASGP